MPDTIIAQRTFGPAPVMGYGRAAKLTATFKLYSLGSQAPYFSITAEVRNPWQQDIVAGGCLHEDIARVFPKVRPFLPLHLSDADGAPMHAKANGWYHAGGTEYKDATNAAYLASHLRIDLAEAERIVAEVAAGAMTKDKFAAYVDAQRPRWKAEAEAALTFLRA